MSYSKTIALGSAGSLVIAESGGNANVTVSLNESVGGGSVSGFAKATLSAEVQVSGAELINAGLALAAAKWPTLASAVTVLQGLIDTELAKL
jgi:hypothetical protein